MFWYDSTYLLLIPAMIIAMWAQAKVSTALTHWKTIRASASITGAQVARALLDQHQLAQVPVEITSGNMGDHYDPMKRTVRLSPEIFQGSSIAALSVAAHETGHAIQHKEAYAFLAFRTAVFPLANFGSSLAFPLFIAGLILSFDVLINVGIVLFSFAVLFQIITLPVEYNASSRAKKMLTQGGYVSQEELSGVQDVLNAAALTYVAAAFMAVMQLLRLLLLSRNRRR
ncbi:MAG: zinc metallopeptidase [Gammaproteobacteria bacterium]|jgi:Zn-dependent membrane protease YugP